MPRCKWTGFATQGKYVRLCRNCWMAIALPATILTGMLSYRHLESPFLCSKKH
jgi:hypothetical protein